MIGKDDLVRMLQNSNFWGTEQDTGIPRPDYLNRMIKMEKMKEATALVGVRRSGKSTITMQFLKHIAETRGKSQTLYVNFEEPVFTTCLNLDLLDTIYNVYREVINPDDFAFIVLDEVQNIPAWEKWVRARQETEKIKIIVTGSSSKLLASEFSTVLSGRSIPLYTFPLSFPEFIDFKKHKIKKAGSVFLEKRKLNALLREYLEFGGFPRVVLESRDNKRALLNEYFEAIVLRDVVARYSIKETGILKTLATILLTSMSSYVSIGKLARTLQGSFRQKTSLETVSRFLQYMESAFLVFFVPLFSYKIKDQMHYPRKVYCIDSGLRNSVSFRFSEDIGRLYENLVFLELKRSGKDIYYWRDRQGKEVDFIIKEGMKVKQAIQVCFSMQNNKTRERELSALIKCMDEFSLKKGTIITENEESSENVNGKRVSYVPLWRWLLDKNTAN